MISSLGEDGETEKRTRPSADDFMDRRVSCCFRFLGRAPGVSWLQTTDQCLRAGERGVSPFIRLWTLQSHPSIHPANKFHQLIRILIHCPSIDPSICSSFIHPLITFIHIDSSPNHINPPLHAFTHLSVYLSVLLPSVHSLINPPITSCVCSVSSALQKGFFRMNLENAVFPLEAASDLNPGKKTSAGM